MLWHSGVAEPTAVGALNLHDEKITHHKITIPGKCKTQKMTEKISGLENGRLNDLHTSTHS